MSEEKDIQDFEKKSVFLESMERARLFLPITNMQNELMSRSALYLEFLAAAFVQETGLKASETELVCFYNRADDSYHWEYRKRVDA